MKKGKHFYSHIIDNTSITLEIANINMSQEERLHLLALAESNIHHTILDVILSELTAEDKIKFMEHLHSDNHDKIWELLNDKVKNIENKIKTAAEDLKKELHKDIEESKK